MNSLKNFVNKVSDKVRESAPPVESFGNDTSVQGFVCPTCFQNFITADELQSHYEDIHIEPSANYLCPVCKARLNSQSELEAHYAANHGTKGNHSIEALQEELMDLSTSLREEKWYSEELKKEVERLQLAFQKKDGSDDYIHKSQYDAVEDSKALLTSEVMLLRKQLAESLNQLSSLRNEKDTLENRASDFAVEKAELRASLDALNSEKINLDIENHDLKKYNEELITKMLADETNVQVTKRIGTLEKENASLKEKESALEGDLKLKSEIASSRQEEAKSLKQEVDLMKIKLQEKDMEASKLKALLETHQMESSSLQQVNEKFDKECLNYKNSIADLETQLCELKMRDSEMTADVIKLSSQNANLQNKLETLETDKNVMSKELLEKNDEIESLKEKLSNVSMEESDILKEKCSQVEEVKKNFRDSEHSRGLLEKSLIEKEDLIAALNTELLSVRSSLEESHLNIIALNKRIRENEKVLSDLEVANKKMEEFKFVIANRDKKLLELDKAIHEEQDKSSNLLKSIEECREEHQKCELFCRSLENELKLSKEENQKNFSSVQNYIKQIELKNSDISQLELNVKKCDCILAEEQDKFNKLQCNYLSLEKSLANNKCRVKELLEESSQLKTEKTELTKRLEKLQKTMVENENYLKNHIESLNLKNDTLCSESQHLNEANLSLNRQLSDATKQLDLLSKENSQLVIDATALKENLEALQSSVCLLEASKQQLESENIELAELKLIHESKLKDLREQMADLLGVSEKEKDKAFELHNANSKLKSEIACLEGEKLELEVKIESAAEEQKGLIERCVASETEVERLQQVTAQLRRKLDDSTAALHELCRENQSLQIETAKLAGRKWTEDSEVTNCLKCGKGFSVTIRKHHCRNCGQIFCNECSSRQAPLDSNKKPVRVCDSCCAELASKI